MDRSVEFSQSPCTVRPCLALPTLDRHWGAALKNRAPLSISHCRARVRQRPTITKITHLTSSVPCNDEHGETLLPWALGMSKTDPAPGIFLKGVHGGPRPLLVSGSSSSSTGGSHNNIGSESSRIKRLGLPYILLKRGP